jgi:hypothetical protein
VIVCAIKKGALYVTGISVINILFNIALGNTYYVLIGINIGQIVLSNIDVL